MATTATHEALVGGAVGRLPSGRAGFAGAVRSEFTKIRSVRSTYWALVALVVACVGIGALFSWGQTQRLLRFESGTTFRGGKVPPGFAEHIANEIRSQAASISLFGLLIGQLIIIVLGALAITSEYSTGMIRSTFSAMPARRLVLAAKAVPASWRQYMPGIATQAAVTVHRSAGLLRPGTAIVVLAVYAVIALGAAAMRVAHRDA